MQSLELSGLRSDEVIVVFVVGDSVGELQAKNIISIEPISLEGVDHNSGLQSGLKISETKNDFLTRFLFPRNQTNCFES